MAKKGSDSNYVSFWFWFFALLVVSLPCIGVIMILIWAFWGGNESRKNYFRAVIAWFFVLLAIWLSLIGLGLLPAIIHQLQIWFPQLKH